jgi:hypothetical protein
VTGHARQGVGTGVDDTIEVEQDQVVVGAEGTRRRAQRPRDSVIGLHGGQPRTRR